MSAIKKGETHQNGRDSKILPKIEDKVHCYRKSVCKIIVEIWHATFKLHTLSAVQKNRAISSKCHRSTLIQPLTGDCPSLPSPPTKAGPQTLSSNTISVVKDECSPSTSFSPPILAKEVNRVKQDTTQTIVKPLQRSLSQTQLVSSMEEHKAEVVQQLLQICSRQSFPEAIVTPLPILNKIKMGYARLQERRDELYGFLDVIGPENARPRRKFQAGHISLLKYAQDNNREINFVAEMLTSFQGFSDIPDSDKLKMFKQFWIQFLILERCYDTFKVVPDKLDSRLVFPEGTIVNTLNGGINVDDIVNLRPEEVLKTCKPWFITVVTKKLLSSVKEFEPTEVEMCFCFSLLLFNVSEIAGEISAQTTCFCKDIVESIYEELNTYYAAEFRHKNVLKRIVELMSLISATEKIAMQRREERLMQEVFNIFNTNIFLDSIFED